MIACDLCAKMGKVTQATEIATVVDGKSGTPPQECKSHLCTSHAIDWYDAVSSLWSLMLSNGQNPMWIIRDGSKKAPHYTPAKGEAL